MKNKLKRSAAEGGRHEEDLRGPHDIIREARAILSGQVERMGPVTSTATRDFIARLIALHKAQVLLLRAERGLDEQARDAGEPAETDLAALRDSIGRKLDRLRAGVAAGAVPADVDGG